MNTQARRGAFFDPRALPIAVKLALGLGVVLVLSGLVTGSLTTQAVRDAQADLTLEELQSFSHTEGLRVVDTLGQEVVTLSRLGTSANIRARMLLTAPTVAEINSLNQAYVPEPVMMNEVQSFRRANEEFSALAVLDTSGRVRAIDPVPPDISDVSPTNWDWYSFARSGGQGTVYISGPRQDFLTGQTGIHIAIPIVSASNPEDVVGVVYGVWNMSNIVDITNVGAGRQGLIVEPAGRVLLSPDEVRGSVVATTLLDNFTPNSAGSFRFADRGGTQWLYGYTSLGSLGVLDPNVQALDWYVITRQPLSQFEESVRVFAGRIRLVTGLSVVGVTVLIAALALLLLYPLRRLTLSAIRIREGDLDAPIPNLPHDEIGNLADVLRGLVQQLLERLKQLDAAVQVSRAASQSLDIDRLLVATAQAIVEQFSFPSARVYLTDVSGREARLVAAAGEGAQDLMRSGDTVVVDETTALGRTILLDEPQVTVGIDRTQSLGRVTRYRGLTLPLSAAGHRLGGIQVLVSEDAVFEQEDIDLLRLLSDQFSTAIQNARLFEQSASNLSEIEALNRRLTRQVWEEYLEEGESLRHTLDPDQAWPHDLENVRQRSDVSAETYTDADGRSILAVPLVLRGESIGSLAVSRPPGAGWSRDEALLLESVASRLAIVAEGIRLVEETSMRAEHERQVNEISANLLQRAASVDGVLRTALGHLSGVLGSDHVSLRLGRPPVDDDRQIGAGGPRVSSDNGQGENGPDKG